MLAVGGAHGAHGARTGGRRRGPARWLAVHACVVGVGWAPVLMAFALNPWLRRAAGALPDALLGPLLLVAALFAVPLVWPLLVAVGWYESGLAAGVAAGERRAVERAVHLSRLIAAALATVAVVAGTASLVTRGDWAGHGLMAWAWVGPALLFGGQAALVRSLVRPQAGP
ncbi:MAG TPA: hypothetical protein VFI47_13170 [Acidimicrobiales bacterium]|nr:hypothetical protein [Acidimicrobiales bacterium]